jgi:Arc/MetJ-type ribon-helix-helix transcriptional regulator
MARIQNSVSLSPQDWAQIDDLVPYFGESRGEVIAHALNVWWGSHEQEIRERKARIDALKPQIEKLVQQSEDRQKKKGQKEPE